MKGVRAILNKSLSKLTGDKIFYVEFIKGDESIRKMQCRMSVKKYLNPNSKGLSDSQKKAKEEFNHLTVVDMGILKKSNLDLNTASKEELAAVRPYRTIPCDRLLVVKAKGFHIERSSVADENWTLIDNRINN